MLQIALVWQDKILAFRLVRPRERITLGPSHRASMNTPRLRSRRAGDRYALLVPCKPRGSFRLRLTEDLGGEVTVAGQRQDVAEILQGGRAVKRDPAVREIELAPGDRARLFFREVPALRIEVRFVDPPPDVARPPLIEREPFLARTIAGTSAAMAMFLAALLVFAPNEDPRPLALSRERVAKLLPPAPPPAPPERGGPKKDEKKVEEKKREDAGQTKRAERERGRVGRSDAVAKESVVPKGEKDLLRDKVSKVGLLGLIGKERPQGSGLAKLFANNSLELEQAVAGLSGAKAVVAGRGSGGLATSGAGLGGGGTGSGHLLGAGELDTGGRSNHGHGHAPTLASRKEREVKLDIATGTLDEGGGLTKEQVARVVRAHANAIKFCYEKELQRKPTLAGKIEVYWVIVPDGSVEKSKIASTTMEDSAVEGCVARQVKQWVFPKSDGRTVVQSYPFLFKGGV